MRLWDAVKASANGVEDDGSYDSPHSADNAGARRAAAFQVTLNDLELPADWGSAPFGVIIETCGPRGLSTLVAFANGDASLLNENGSGIIGRQNHVHVVKQARRLVACASELASLLRPTPAPSRPEPQSIHVHFLTNAGLLSTTLRMSARSAEGPWSSFMDIADELISEFSQYLLPDIAPAGQPKPIEFVRSLMMVTAIGGLTYGASLIPISWIRWPLVAIGLFFTAAALFVFYLMLAGPRDDEVDEADAAPAR